MESVIKDPLLILEIGLKWKLLIAYLSITLGIKVLFMKKEPERGSFKEISLEAIKDCGLIYTSHRQWNNSALLITRLNLRLETQCC